MKRIALTLLAVLTLFGCRGDEKLIAAFELEPTAEGWKLLGPRERSDICEAIEDKAGLPEAACLSCMEDAALKGLGTRNFHAIMTECIVRGARAGHFKSKLIYIDPDEPKESYGPDTLVSEALELRTTGRMDWCLQAYDELGVEIPDCRDCMEKHSHSKAMTFVEALTPCP